MSGPHTEPPIGWACCWAFATSRPPFHSGKERVVYDTQEAARAQLVRVRALGDLAAACVVPVFAKRPNPMAPKAKRAALDALGLPVQLSPRAAERRRGKAGHVDASPKR